MATSTLANAFGNYLMDKGYDVSAPIGMFYFVKGDGAGGVTPVTATTDEPLGVAQFHVTASEILKGKGASVRVSGIAQVYCTGAVTLGDALGLVADGSVRTAASTDLIVGQARSDGASGGRCACQISLPGSIKV